MKPPYLIALMLLIALLFAASMAGAQEPAYDAKDRGHVSACVSAAASISIAADGTLDKTGMPPDTWYEVVHTTDGIYINF